MSSLEDNIRGAIIRESMGTWENRGRVMLDEVDLEAVVVHILEIIKKQKEETPY